ncbi:dUTP diphosphatase [Caldifermentibacillus hisashii]|uniref:Deoxyuridine 5'-triphosphate nucleotidohydrolase n=2 Tax=Bacillaceae TaxID=186817 RepID=A0ABD4A1J4_9BACI|nr:MULTISPECIES: dUTP diphosphatase [Bacillaceae]KIO61001.1 Deoxyuridine 5'-triphosphate nucleotidohydrolase [Caldibacillus thermoamylovorans]KIO70094.1 Deoxyuridine 5'-triphosphate nucleotidohydrolase [Caldibacillus thermoamylovorans]MCM3054042.1 dUTP diphosphatase [Caldibacillus thermoamylovorans]PAC35434.1 deoxyuridine 5'-triphosphate nucleotidohydrolase [Caldifermentibacillus hisashii]
MNDQLKVKLIKEDAKLPQYANPGDAGLDLFSVEEKIIKPGEFELISTGISLELPPGTEAQVRPRSGLALKHGITLLNSPGTIDEGYRGEVKVMLINHGKKEFKVEKHMRIAQMVIAPVTRMNVIEVEEISDSVRGEGGFGSTGW